MQTPSLLREAPLLTLEMTLTMSLTPWLSEFHHAISYATFVSIMKHAVLICHCHVLIITIDGIQTFSPALNKKKSGCMPFFIVPHLVRVKFAYSRIHIFMNNNWLQNSCKYVHTENKYNHSIAGIPYSNGSVPLISS